MVLETEYYRRTGITPINRLPHHDHGIHRATVEQWLDGCNIASDLAWENDYTQAGVRNVARDTV
jgi:hypothetical protein